MSAFKRSLPSTLETIVSAATCSKELTALSKQWKIRAKKIESKAKELTNVIKEVKTRADKFKDKSLKIYILRGNMEDVINDLMNEDNPSNLDDSMGVSTSSGSGNESDRNDISSSVKSISRRFLSKSFKRSDAEELRKDATKLVEYETKLYEESVQFNAVATRIRGEKEGLERKAEKWRKCALVLQGRSNMQQSRECGFMTSSVSNQLDDRDSVLKAADVNCDELDKCSVISEISECSDQSDLQSNDSSNVDDDDYEYDDVDYSYISSSDDEYKNNSAGNSIDYSDNSDAPSA